MTVFKPKQEIVTFQYLDVSSGYLPAAVK